VYSLAEKLVYMHRRKDDGQHAWLTFKDKDTIEAFVNEYKSRWPNNNVVEKYKLAPHTYSYIITD
jgi:hypothetical protein